MNEQTRIFLGPGSLFSALPHCFPLRAGTEPHTTGQKPRVGPTPPPLHPSMRCLKAPHSTWG